MNSDKMKKSETGDGIAAENASWKFSGKTVDHFDSHITKSVPFYEEGQTLITKYSDFFVRSDSRIYDIGCSTGTLTRNLARRHAEKNLEIIGIDCEEDMIKKAKEETKKNTNHQQKSRLKFISADIINNEWQSCCLVTSYYTLQFVHPARRQDVLNSIYKSLEWGGALIIFEKVRGPDARFQDIASQMYADYKMDNGYTSDEILAKSRSLKGILEPFSSQANINMLRRSGFNDISSIFKFICFEGFIAIK